MSRQLDATGSQASHVEPSSCQQGPYISVVFICICIRGPEQTDDRSRRLKIVKLNICRKQPEHCSKPARSSVPLPRFVDTDPHPFPFWILQMSCLVHAYTYDLRSNSPAVYWTDPRSHRKEKLPNTAEGAQPSPGGAHTHSLIGRPRVRWHYSAWVDKPWRLQC